MWTFTKLGFASAVQHRSHHDVLIVRFRDPKDAAAYAKALKVAAGMRRTPKVTATRAADYGWRLQCHKDQWQALLGELTQEIDYDNFKSMMHHERPNWAGSELMGVWSITARHQYEIQDGRVRMRNIAVPAQDDDHNPLLADWPSADAPGERPPF